MRKVNKKDYYIHRFTGGYYGICLKQKGAPEKCVYGGDSANEDDYDLALVNLIYRNWTGKLVEGHINTDELKGDKC